MDTEDLLRSCNGLLSPFLSLGLVPLTTLACHRSVSPLPVPGGQWSIRAVSNFYMHDPSTQRSMRKVIQNLAPYTISGFLYQSACETTRSTLLYLFDKAEEEKLDLGQLDPLCKPEPNRYDTMHSALSSVVGSMVGALVVLPFYKARFHLHTASLRKDGDRYRDYTTWRFLKEMHATDGIAATWFRHLPLNMVQAVVHDFVSNQTAHYRVSQVIQKKTKNPTNTVKALLRAVGLIVDELIISVCITIACAPLETIFRRLEFQQGLGGGASDGGVVYSGALNCAQHILRSEGISGFYKGALPAFLQLFLPSLPSAIMDLSLNLYYGVPVEESESDSEDGY